MYQIHEVCERCHLSRKAIRLYEEKGLLHPDRIQGNRMYNKEDVVRLQCISYYRGLGFSLEQIPQRDRDPDAPPVFPPDDLVREMTDRSYEIMLGKLTKKQRAEILEQNK